MQTGRTERNADSSASRKRVTNIPALRAKGLHRGKLNTKARFAFVITEETKDLTAPKFHHSEFTLSWRKTLPVNRQLREHILP